MVAQARPTAGFIDEITCRLYLRASETAQPRLLNPQRSRARVLHAGEWLRCKGRGSARLFLENGTKILTAAEDWYPIARVISADIGRATPLTADEERNRRALQELDVPAATRGDSSPVLTPPEGGSVRPDEFVIRWVPSMVEGPLLLRLVDQKGSEIWRQDRVAASAGTLAPVDARDALTKFHDTADTTLRLIVVDARSTFQTQFSVLSAQTLARLDDALALWGKEPRLLRSIGRASVFTSTGLYVEAAAEYDAALADAPRSEHLLRMAIWAHTRAGHPERIDDLRARLRAESGH
jgi:hypothetical protein